MAHMRPGAFVFFYDLQSASRLLSVILLQSTFPEIIELQKSMTSLLEM